MIDRIFIYTGSLAPIFIIFGLTLAIVIVRNVKARKAGEKRGLFE